MILTGSRMTIYLTLRIPTSKVRVSMLGYVCKICPSPGFDSSGSTCSATNAQGSPCAGQHARRVCLFFNQESWRLAWSTVQGAAPCERCATPLAQCWNQSVCHTKWSKMNLHRICLHTLDPVSVVFEKCLSKTLWRLPVEPVIDLALLLSTWWLACTRIRIEVMCKHLGFAAIQGSSVTVGVYVHAGSKHETAENQGKIPYVRFIRPNESCNSETPSMSFCCARFGSLKRHPWFDWFTEILALTHR